MNTSLGNLQISAIEAFEDNYIWLIRGPGTACAVVDPGDHEPVLQVLQDQGLDLRYILLTHHHWDHAGGIPGLLETFDAEVFGPADERLGSWCQAQREGDRFALDDLGLTFSVLEVPAHTRSHIAFVSTDVLFSGDTLFSMGCGKLFEGTPAQMQAAMDKFARLPRRTKVFCGHEYTESNCRFALQVEPNNPALQDKAERVAQARKNGLNTLPSTIGEELDANPFMRTRAAPVVAAARRLDPDATPGAETLGLIRAWKDGSRTP